MTAPSTAAGQITATEVARWFAGSRNKKSDTAPNAKLCESLAQYLEGVRQARLRGKVRIGKIDIDLAEWRDDHPNEKKLDADLRKKGKAFESALKKKIAILHESEVAHLELRSTYPELHFAKESDDFQQVHELRSIIDAMAHAVEAWNGKKVRRQMHWHYSATYIKKLIADIWQTSGHASAAFHKDSPLIEVVRRALYRSSEVDVKAETIARTFERYRHRSSPAKPRHK